MGMTLVGSAPVPFIAQYERFLAAEEGATDRLRSFYAQSNAELRAFLLDPPVSLTASEQAFYGALTKEVDRLAQVQQVGSSAWVRASIPKAFVEGALQHSSTIAFDAVHDRAVKSLSGYTLDLITRMNADMRRIVQQQIAVGILEGAPRQVVSQRILDSGLTNIPRWRSVEERAAVIARTEIMRAYNAGNLAGIRDTGAIAVKWITGRDEFVCGICGPRHNQRFALAKRTPEGATVPFPPLPGGPPPAHPRCRCTIRAVYDLAGDVFGEPTTPQPPPGGVIEATPRPKTSRSDAETV